MAPGPARGLGYRCAADSLMPPSDPVTIAPLDLMPSLEAGSDELLQRHWRSRIEQHFADSYAGIPISKFPEDLRTYERLIWERAPNVVIEVGVQQGASTLWFRDRLFAFQRYRTGPAPLVIGIDVDLAAARRNFDGLPPGALAGIDLREGDIADVRLLEQVVATVPADAEVLVVEDAAHDHDTTLAALHGLAPLVKGGGYYVVEDTCVDVERLRVGPDWPRGAGVALSTWLRDDPLGRRFRRRPDTQPYGLTCHPGGVLQRLTDL